MKWALRTPTHKLILARAPDAYGSPMRELYDLRNDSHEFHNITADALEQHLEVWLADKMAANHLDTDPLLAHGLSLGKEREASEGV